MSKPLKLSGTAYRRVKTSRGVTLTKYAGSIDAYEKENRKIKRGNYEKAGELE